MGKFFTCFLLVGSLLCISNFSNAQNVDLFASPSSITIDPGETVTVSFFGNNFTGVTGFGGTVHWESAQLTFVEVSPLSQGLPGITFNESQVGAGNLIFGWFDPGAGVDLMPTDLIFAVTFIGNSSGTTTVDFASVPAATTIVQGITEYVPVTVPSTVTVTGSPPTNSPTFAYDCTDFSELAFYSAFDTVATGDKACLEIAVCGFDNITGFEYTLDYDQTILQFDSTANYNLTELTEDNFGTTNSDQGFISVAWFNNSDNGITVDDETTIFEVCFTAIGAGGTMDSLFINSSQTTFQASDTSQMQIPVESGPGYVVITGTAPQAVTLFASDEEAPTGQNVCVDVKTKNFNDMISMGFTMEWDETIVEFDSLIDPNNYFNGTILTSSNTMPSLVDTGALTINWIAAGTMPTTLMDSSVFFQVCFNTIGDPAEVSPVQFTSSLVPKDATQDDGNGMPVDVPLATTDGSVTIDENSNPGGFVFNLSDTTACQGDTITISFLATGFTDIATLGFQINWDINQLQWIGLHDITLPQLFSPNTSPAFTSVGKMTGLWFDFGIVGKSFPDGTKLFQMDFEVVGPGSQVANLTFSSGDDNMPALAVGAPGNVPLPFTTNDGVVTCSNNIPPIVITGVVTDVECNGESNGAIDITLADNTDPTVITWDGPGTFSSMSEDLTGLAAGTYNVTATDAVGAVGTASFTVNEPDVLNATATTTNAICNGGSGGAIDVTVTGGNSGYNFAWDNSLPAQEDQTDLTAGTYCVTIMDALDCSFETCFTVNENSIPTIDSTITGATCSNGDGAIDLTISGGISGYTFSWDNSLPAQEDQTGLDAGTYCVTVTDNASCPVEACFTVVLETPSHTVTSAITDASCTGATDGEIDLTVSGGTSPYVFTWDNGLPSQEDQTGLTNGTYCVTIADANGCEINDCFDVGAGTADHTVSESITDASCPGATDGEIDLTVSGGTSPYVFTWDNGLPSQEDQTGLTNGTYCVTIADANGCEINDCFDVGAGTADHTVSESITDASCPGATDGEIDLTVSGGTSPYVFTWDSGLPSQEDQTGLTNGTYCVTIADANGCEINDCFDVGAGTADHTVSESITDASCTGATDGEIDLTVSGGTSPYVFTWDSGLPSQEDQTGLTNGTYCVTIADANGCEINDCFDVGAGSASHTVSASITDASCTGAIDGAIDLTVSGGATPYVFTWDSGLPSQEDQTGLTNGTYCVTIADANGCEINDCIDVGAGTASHTVSESITDASCGSAADGEIDLTVSGGTSPYVFTWDSGLPSQEDQTGLTAGTYCVTIADANGCEINDCFDVGTGTASHTVSESITDATCGNAADGEIDLTVSGGTSPYVFTWDSGLPSQEDQTGLTAGTYCVTIADANGCEINDCFDVGVGNAGHTASAAITDASCGGLADGEIDLTVSGGATPYVFTWDSGLPSQEDQTGLLAGTYCATITDANNCTINDCFVVGEEVAAHTVSASITEAGCNGAEDGEIDLTVSGGTSPYVFSWDSGLPSQEDQTGLESGTYCVTITDANNCAMNDCFQVTEQDAPSISAEITHVTCHGFANGAIDLTINGGAGNYTIDWGAQGSNEDLAGLIAGDYTVTVNDANGCMVSETFTVNEPAEDLTATATGTDVSCNGFDDGSIDLSVSGGTTPYVFDWDNGAADVEDPSGLSPNTYSVTITDANGCIANATVVINEPAALSISPTVVHESLPGANDGSIALVVSGGIEPYEYEWDPAMGNNSTISSLAPGNYDVTVTDANGCEISASYTIDPSVIPQITGFFITDADCAGSASGGVDITVVGGVPTVTYLWNDDNGSITQDLVGVPAGSYTVTITDGDNNEVIGGPYIVNETSTITYSETHVDTRCVGVNDGSITLTIEGGSGFYNVFWDGSLEGNPLTGLAPGTYTPIIVDDEGCERIGVGITINAPDPIDIQVSSVTNNICKNGLDGAISLSISGGNPNYLVSWGAAGSGATVTGLAAGTYTPTITDAEGCVEIGPDIEITEPSLIRGNPIVGEITCNGDSDAFINIAPTGGNGGYQFMWNFNGATSEDLEDLGPGTYILTITDVLGCSEVLDPIVINQPDVINISASVGAASPSNDDGSINLTVTGGNGNYDYDWLGEGGPFDNSNTLIGLASGEYFVTVTDAKGCTQTGQYVVSGSLGISGEVMDVSCFGGDDGGVNLTINGGTEPLSFQWSPGFANGQNLNDVSAGTYSVTVEDANGILSTSTFTIDEPTQIVITNIEATNESGAGCNGSIDIQVVGGSPPYTYQWSNGMMNQNPEDLCKGDYSVDVIDSHGCVVTSEEITIGPASVTITNFDIVDLGCPGEANAEICFEIFGGCAPYNVTVDGQSVIDLDGSLCVDDLAAGSYTITVVDNFSASTTYPFTITQAAGISATTEIINNTDLVNCNGSINLTVTGGSPAYSYQWSHGPISEDVGDLCDNLSPYSVTITDSNGCTEVITGLEVDFGITIIADVMDVCDVDNCDGAIDLEVVGGTGTYTYAWSNDAVSEDIFEVCGGAYTVTVTDTDGNMAEQTFVVESPMTGLSITLNNLQHPTGPANGLIDVNITGGYGGYTYAWSNSAVSQDIAGLPPGSYVLTVTDQNGCVDVQPFVLNPPGEAITFTLDEPLCNGSADGCVEAIPEIGTPPYTYAWSTGGNTQKVCGLGSGSFTVTITDADGLELVGSTVLTDPSPLLVSISDEGENSLLANVTGGASPYNYNWNSPNADTDPQIFDLAPGVYSVLVTDSNDCSNTAMYDLFPDGDCEDVRNIITPNNDGDNETFVIVCAYEIVDSELEIYNRWGQLVHESVSYDNSWRGTDLDGSPLPEGGYFYVFRYAEPGSSSRIESKGFITILR